MISAGMRTRLVVGGPVSRHVSRVEVLTLLPLARLLVAEVAHPLQWFAQGDMVHLIGVAQDKGKGIWGRLGCALRHTMLYLCVCTGRARLRQDVLLLGGGRELLPRALAKADQLRVADGAIHQLGQPGDAKLLHRLVYVPADLKARVCCDLRVLRLGWERWDGLTGWDGEAGRCCHSAVGGLQAATLYCDLLLSVSGYDVPQIS